MQDNIETRVGLFVLLALGVFAYMGFHVGAFRFDRGHYAHYVISFQDISGLSRKADVKIAGVKVGWVENISLIPDGSMHAQITVMIQKKYPLYADAYAIVRQDGMLEPHFIEIIPGDSSLSTLPSGSLLNKPSRSATSVGELLDQFKKIAVNVQEVTESLKEVIGGVEGKEQLNLFFNNMHTTMENASKASAILECAFGRNEGNIDKLLEIGTHVGRIADRLDRDLFPVFQNSVEKISNAFDRDFDRITSRLDITAEAFEQASAQACESLRNVNSVAEKIDGGKGVLGKLVNEDHVYQDLHVAVNGLKNYITKIDRLQLIFDTHFEGMLRRAENYQFENSKGYFSMRIHPNEDHFYLVQVVTSEKGFAHRRQIENTFINTEGNEIDITKIDLDKNTLFILPEDITVKREEMFHRNSIKVGLQFGKIYKDIALRLGLFEGSAGAAVDIDIPFETEKFRWVTTFEMFDLRGWNRHEDKRPHLKWLNRIFILNNIYVTFGADDFVSKRNASAFMGAGLRFGDDDVKCILGSVSGAGSSIAHLQS